MSRIKAHLILALLTLLMLIAPDFLAKIFSNSDEAVLHGKFLLGVLAFGLFLSIASRLTIFIILGFFVFLELIQFGHLFYYRSFISSAKFALFFKQMDEVFAVGKEAMSFLYFVPFVVILPYAILLYAFHKFENIRFKSIIANIIVTLLLLIIPYRVGKVYHGINYYPDPADHSLRNSLYAFANFIMNEISPGPRANIAYKDYQINIKQDSKKDKVNIVLIIGESVNPLHMSLFGYKLETNPMLSGLKKDPHFKYGRTISGGVDTKVSVMLLLNGIYEPNNYKAFEEIPVNLFKLAKKQGFKTFFLSAQSGSALTNIGYEFIDHIVFYQKNPLLFNKYQDGALLQMIPELEYGEKNFIVLHQRNIHAPYEFSYENYPEFDYFPVEKNDYKIFLRDTYDNAMRFNDSLLYKFVDFYKHKFNTPTYIFFTPDHSEGVGDNNIYGHLLLHEQIYNVMYFLYTANITNNLQFTEPVCHYEIHNAIAKLMGIDILNPNLKKDMCYVQGPDIHGLNEYVEVKKK